MVQTASPLTLRRAFADFLIKQRIAGPEDDTVLDYVVETAASDAIDVESLDELLSGFAPTTWGALDLDSRVAQLTKLLHQVARYRPPASSDAHYPAMQPSAANGAATQRMSHLAAQRHNPPARQPRQQQQQKQKPHTRVEQQLDGAAQQHSAAQQNAAQHAEQRRLHAKAVPSAAAAPCVAPPGVLFPNEKDGVETAIDAFLTQHGGPALREDAVAEYVQGMLADRDAAADAGTIEQLDDVLCGFDADCWAAQPEVARHAALCQLLSEISSLLRQQEPSCAPEQPPWPHQVSAAADSATAAGGPAAAAGTHSAGVSADGQLTIGASAADRGEGRQQADPAAVATLRELCCDGASPDFLAHVLTRQCHGDLEAAAQQLVEWGGELPRREAAWRRALAEAEAAAAREQAAAAAKRRRLFARFDLQAVPEGGGDGRRSRKGQAEVDAWQPAEDAKRNVRYRDGRPVSTRGEKYIIENLREEFDGGSRGRVKTKGKRGVGFV